MSESTEPLKFDPESVERWNTGSDVIDACIEGTALEMVSAADFDVWYASWLAPSGWKYLSCPSWSAACKALIDLRRPL